MDQDNTKNEQKSIVFINQDSGYLMIDIINAYVNAGYACTLLAGRLVERSYPLEASVKIEKVIRYNRNSVLKRLFTWCWATVQIIWIIKTKYRKSKLFIVSNPPFAPLIPLLINNPFSVLIFDIYPETLLESGYISEKSYLMRWWGKANKRIYKRADRIYTISSGMKQILKNYVNDIEVEVVPLWADNLFLKPIDRDSNPFLKEHDLLNKFVVLYSGNLGLSSEINVLIDIASRIDRKDIAFVIIGEGAKRKMIQQKIAMLNLRNVLLLPLQPANELAYSLSSANLAVVVLGEKISKLAMPSKIYSYISVGAPVLCFSSSDSDVAQFVSNNKIGKSFDPEKTEYAIDYIIWLADNPEECKLLSKESLALSSMYSPMNAQRFV